jgi:hypothetical protein
MEMRNHPSTVATLVVCRRSRLVAKQSTERPFGRDDRVRRAIRPSTRSGRGDRDR